MATLTMNKVPVTGGEGQNGLFASAVYDKLKDEIIVKVANTSGQGSAFDIEVDGWKKKRCLCRTLHQVGICRSGYGQYDLKAFGRYTS